jgi:hypothetical protein
MEFIIFGSGERDRILLGSDVSTVQMRGGIFISTGMEGKDSIL